MLTSHAVVLYALDQLEFPIIIIIILAKVEITCVEHIPTWTLK